MTGPLLTLNVHDTLRAALHSGAATVECSLDPDRSRRTGHRGWVWQRRSRDERSGASSATEGRVRRPSVRRLLHHRFEIRHLNDLLDQILDRVHISVRGLPARRIRGKPAVKFVVLCSR